MPREELKHVINIQCPINRYGDCYVAWSRNMPMLSLRLLRSSGNMEELTRIGYAGGASFWVLVRKPRKNSRASKSMMGWRICWFCSMDCRIWPSLRRFSSDSGSQGIGLVIVLSQPLMIYRRKGLRLMNMISAGLKESKLLRKDRLKRNWKGLMEQLEIKQK